MAKTTSGTTGGTTNDGSCPKKPAVFVSKNIVQKKQQNPQRTLEKHFRVTKPKRKVVEKNFQGFPLSSCRFEEEVGKFVYCPPGYCVGMTVGAEDAGKKAMAMELCHECYLKPCIVRGKWHDILGFCEEVMVFETDDSEVMHSKMLNRVDSLLVEIFGARHVRNHEPPSCVLGLLHDCLGTKVEMEEEDDPDYELAAAAVDG